MKKMIYVCIWISLCMTRMLYKVNFKAEIKTFEFNFYSRKVAITRFDDPRLLYYILVAGKIVFRYMLFPRVPSPWEMRKTSSLIRFMLPMFISYNDRYYTPGISEKIIYSLSGLFIAKQSTEIKTWNMC